jgi:hypothetical protein
MKKHFVLVGVVLALTAFAFAASAFYDAPSPTKLEGVIHDFSPQSTAPMGPYVVSGPWSLQFQPSGNASFSASLTMVRSDLNVAAFGGADSQAARNFHTHHIDITDGSASTVNNVLVVTGNARITSNGNEVFPGSSVRIEVSGGNTVSPSNLKMTILGPAAAHFTTEPYEGVVLSH